MELFSIIKELRKQRGLTQKDLASKINITDKTVSRWETGDSQPNLEQLQCLADVFDTEVSDLLSGKVLTVIKEPEPSFVQKEEMPPISDQMINKYLSVHSAGSVVNCLCIVLTVLFIFYLVIAREYYLPDVLIFLFLSIMLLAFRIIFYQIKISLRNCPSFDNKQNIDSQYYSKEIFFLTIHIVLITLIVANFIAYAVNPFAIDSFYYYRMAICFIGLTTLSLSVVYIFIIKKTVRHLQTAALLIFALSLLPLSLSYGFGVGLKNGSLPVEAEIPVYITVIGLCAVSVILFSAYKNKSGKMTNIIFVLFAVYYALYVAAEYTAMIQHYLADFVRDLIFVSLRLSVVIINITLSFLILKKSIQAKHMTVKNLFSFFLVLLQCLAEGVTIFFLVFNQIRTDKIHYWAFPYVMASLSTWTLMIGALSVLIPLLIKAAACRRIKRHS